MRLALDEPDNLLRHIYALEQKAGSGSGWLVGQSGCFGKGVLSGAFLKGDQNRINIGGKRDFGLYKYLFNLYINWTFLTLF